MPTTKAKQKTNRSKAISHRHTSGVEKRVEHQPTKVRFGKLQRSKITSAVGNGGAFAIKPIKKTITALQVDELQGSNSYSVGAQLEMIEHLQPVLKKHFNIKDSKGWNADTHPSAIIKDLFLQANLDDKFDNWSIETNETTNRFELEVRREYGQTNAIFLHVDFLAKLNTYDKELHNWIVYALCLCIKNNRLHTYFDWLNHGKGAEGMIYEYAKEKLDWYNPESDAEYAELQQCLEYYSVKGQPLAYYKYIMGAHASIRIFDKQLADFKRTTEEALLVKSFLEAALKLAKTGEYIHAYCENEDGYSTPSDYMVIVWCVDEEDWMYKTFCEFIDDQAQNIGVQGFTWTETLTESNSTSERNEAICDLFTDYFTKGRAVATYFSDKLKNYSNAIPQPLKPKIKDEHRLINKLV